MDDNTKKEFILLFNQGFEEVVMPQIEDLREEINRKFDNLEARVDRLETVVDHLETVTDNMDRKLDRILDNEIVQNNRLNKIESVSAVANQ